MGDMRWEHPQDLQVEMCFAHFVGSTGHHSSILWVVPPPSNSHHQDYYMFSRGSRTKPPFATGILGGGTTESILSDLHGIIDPLLATQQRNVGLQTYDSVDFIIPPRKMLHWKKKVSGLWNKKSLQRFSGEKNSLKVATPLTVSGHKQFQLPDGFGFASSTGLPL